MQPMQMSLNLAALKSELIRKLDDDLPLREFGELYMEYILASCNGNKSKAAQILGVNRRTVYRIISRKETRAIPRGPELNEEMTSECEAT